MQFDTLQVHGGTAPDPATGARQVPIYQSTAFVFKDAEQAARLFAAADTLRTAIHIPLPSPERPEYDRAVALVRTIMGDAAFEAAWRDGALLTLETALAAANALAASQ